MFIFLLIVPIFWQNCGQVQLEKLPQSIEESSVLSGQGVLKVNSYNVEQLRLGIILDMSQSMQTGPCNDSMDVLIDDVTALDCSVPSGVDPEGKRFRLVLDWISGLEDKVSKGIFKYENIRIGVFPFSNPLMNKYWSLENTYNSKNVITSYSVMNSFAKKLGVEKELVPGFVNLQQAKNYIFLLWGIFSYIQGAEYPKEIPEAIVKVLPSKLSELPVSTAGTSVVAPAIEKLNTYLFKELNALAELKKLNSSYFELAFVSDGVPKPHAKHVEKVMDYVWHLKKEVCDITEYGPYFRSCADDTSVKTGWKIANAASCSLKCSNYVRRYVDEGGVIVPEVENSVCVQRDSSNRCVYYSVPGKSQKILNSDRWSNANITCNQCFEMLSQYKYNSVSCAGQTCSSSFRTDTFKSDIVQGWGDWIFNNHTYILARLKETESLFAIRNPEVKFHMNFIRVDANLFKYETQSGELVKDINWINKAHEYFSAKQSFIVLKNNETLIDVFPEFSDIQKFQLGVIYVVNQNVKTTSQAVFKFDADGDGLIDELETSTNLSKVRTDGICMDAIKSKFSECVTIGCDPKLDRDGDGLNECEEKTYGTDDYNPDSDKDSILDYDEVIMGYNPTDNDQEIYFNSDGYSNYEHFMKGLSFKTNFNEISNDRKLNININQEGISTYKNDIGLDVEMPIYKIKITNIPYVHDHDAVAKDNELVVRIRIDDKKNPQNNYWYTKTYQVSPKTKEIPVFLSDFSPLIQKRILK